MLLPNYDELRAAGHKPRVHGNGFIQLDLNDDGTKRLHVWHEDIPRQTVPTPIHDHVFSIRSTVLTGLLIHEELVLTRGPEGTHWVCHAEQQPGTQNTILVPDDEMGVVGLEVAQHLRLAPGSIYTFPAWHFHQTDHVGLTATIMDKINAPAEYGRPRVLVPKDAEPDNDFHRDGHDEELLWRMIEAALIMAENHNYKNDPVAQATVARAQRMMREATSA